MVARSVRSANQPSRAGRVVAAVLVAAALGGMVVACSTPGTAPGGDPSSLSPMATPSVTRPNSPSPSASPTLPSASPSRGKPASSPSTQEPTNNQVVIDITIADGKVDPNGRKLDVPLDAAVVLNVTSDIDDEIHAHLGNDDFTLKVTAGQPKSGRFTANAPGSFEVESHELGKIIVILNVR